MKNYPKLILSLLACCLASAETMQNHLTLECMQPGTEPRTDSSMLYDPVLLQMYGQEMQQVMLNLSLRAYKNVAPDSEMMKLIGHAQLVDGMDEYALVIPPASAGVLYVLHFCWDGKVKRLRGHWIHALPDERTK